MKDGSVYTANKIILTVPIWVLQKWYITFAPQLPAEKIEAIDSVDFFPGFKLFMKFDEKFYPDAVFVDTEYGEKTYYDAAYGKNSEENILWLLSMWSSTYEYYELGGEKEIVTAVLEELDDVSEWLASEYYTNEYIFKDRWRHQYTLWTRTNNSDDETFLDALTLPVHEKIYFAWEAYNTYGQRSTVHWAVVSWYESVYNLLKLNLK